MLTVKVHRYSKNNDGAPREVILSAQKVETNYHESDNEVIRYCVVHTNTNEAHSFDIDEQTIIYVENLNKKTVQVYKK